MSDQITPAIVRSNAESLLVWYGRDAEGEVMKRAKDCIAQDQPEGAEIQMRILREVRRLLAKDEAGWMKKHRACAAQVEKGRAERAERRNEVEEGARPVVMQVEDASKQSEHFIMYTVDTGEDDAAKKAEALERYRAEHNPGPDAEFNFIRITFVEPPKGKR